MQPVRTSFGSHLSSSQTTKLRPDQFVSSNHSESDKRGKKRNKNRPEKAGRPLLKVKLPKLKSLALTAKGTKDVKTPTKRTSKTKSTINQESQTESGANTASALVDGDVFFFTQRSSTQPTNEKEMAKLSVLRTISKMLEENRLIRRRLSVLSQAI
ncbi:hypothetical protein CRENBAI_007453 [Crenichthys baileyi]|uniref:Uncharacterized protein n=1 Tax=Crenichthys baileyi TaxID=28760 RepID=A0AAV9SG44_9TELE